MVETGLYRILFYSGFGSDRLIEDSVLFRVRFRQVYTGLFSSGFGSDRFIQDSVFFRVRFRQVYTGFCFIQGSVQTGLYRIRFIQGSVQTGLYRILFSSGFGSDRFIQDSVLFRVRFRQVYIDSVLFRVWLRQVYTGFCFIQGLVETGLYRILFYSGFGSYRILFYSGFG